MSEPRYSEILPGGAMWSMRIPRHRLVRLTALEAGANVSALLYNADQPLDRLNVPDTLKALHTAKLTKGHILMSDMGHALASIVEDTLGWHDPLGGHLMKPAIERKYGGHTYQKFRNDFYRSARENFVVELNKHGLGLRDIVANVNFFSKVVVSDEGTMAYVPNHAPEGASITLRADMNVLLVLANCPHPMGASGAYPFREVQVDVFSGTPPESDDFCRNFRPECARTLDLTQRLFI